MIVATAVAAIALSALWTLSPTHGGWLDFYLVQEPDGAVCASDSLDIDCCRPGTAGMLMRSRLH